MATSTRQAKAEAKALRDRLTNDYTNRLKILFHNCVEVENEGELPKRYLLETLYNKGGIAYDKETGLFLPFVASGIDIYGLPKLYTLIGYEGTVLTRNADEVVILRANDLRIPLADYIETQVNKIVDYDIAIRMNLEATKTMTIMSVADRSTLLSVANEQEAKRIGATVVFEDKNSMVGAECKVQSTGAQFLVDKLLEARKETLNETFATIGISVANTEKRERVQGLEVQASQGYAKDSINTLIDTFNYDAEKGGLPIRLKANTSLMTEREEVIDNEQI